jgi:di/tricarboxylate transporter
MLMPLSVAALVSGMMTLIASSPNLIIEDTLKSRGLASIPFTLSGKDCRLPVW